LPSAGNKIEAVGSLAEVLKAAGKGAERVDLGEKTLFPGLIDSHAHPIEVVFSLIQCGLCPGNAPTT
jgi:predicted amidohydrolase YtcJ